MPINTSPEHRALVTETALKRYGTRCLLPEHLRKKWLNLPVLDSLRIPSHPRESLNCDIQGQVIDYNKYIEKLRPFTLGVIEQGSEKCFLVDKAYPHAQNELMLIAGNGKVHPSMFDLSDFFSQKIFSTMAIFGEYSESQNLTPHISWSYDPDTRVDDRPTGQGVKWFHAHLIGRKPDEINQIQNLSKPLKDVHPLRRRRIVDETQVLLSNILSDIINNQENTPVHTYPALDNPENIPAMVFDLSNGWDTLKEKKYWEFARRIHETFESIYRDIIGIISEEGEFQENREWFSPNVNAWERPHLKPKEEYIKELQDYFTVKGVTLANQADFQYFLDSLNTRIQDKAMLQELHELDRDNASIIYPLAGPCYSSAITKISSKYYYIIRPYLFSDLGGAGIAYNQGITTKTKKGCEVFTPQEMEIRQLFQNGFLKSVSRPLLQKRTYTTV